MDQRERLADLEACGAVFSDAYKEALNEAAGKVSPKENFDA